MQYVLNHTRRVSESSLRTGAVAIDGNDYNNIVRFNTVNKDFSTRCCFQSFSFSFFLSLLDCGNRFCIEIRLRENLREI